MRKVLALVLLTLCASAGLAEAPPAYFVDPAKLPFDELEGLPSQRTWGILHGAGYRIEVPANWNGSLVMWAHGFRGEVPELIVDQPPFRAYLLANGFAWAASSYSRNGYEAAQGAFDTHTLAQFFSSKFGRPNRTYVTGADMGGHIAAVIAERWPRSYDGAMSMCGWLGDYEMFDFHLDFNVAAQTLADTNETFPFGDDYLSVTVPQVKDALGGATFPLTLSPAGLQFRNVVTMRSGGVRPLSPVGFQYWANFLFAQGLSIANLSAQPGIAVDNAGIVYQLDADPALSAEEIALNALVQRVSADPSARKKGMTSLAPTTGDLGIPMLTLQALGDLYVPFSLAQIYAERVASRNASGLLVQRAIRDIGHCTFTTAEETAAFADLVNWVTSGVKPMGDDVLDPVAVAQPTFGCMHTSERRPFDPLPYVCAE